MGGALCWPSGLQIYPPVLAKNPSVPGNYPVLTPDASTTGYLKSCMIPDYIGFWEKGKHRMEGQVPVQPLVQPDWRGVTITRKKAKKLGLCLFDCVKGGSVMNVECDSIKKHVKLWFKHAGPGLSGP